MIEAMEASYAQDPEGAGGRYLFDAVLIPQRSLSPLGFWLLMLAVVGIAFAGGIGFLRAGAWPVIGFVALDMALVYWAFRASYRSGRLYESVRLNEDALWVERVSPSGRVRSWRFQPYWLKVEMEDSPAHGRRLTLRSHGNALEIGAFLSPAERLEVAEGLRAALARLQSAGRS